MANLGHSAYLAEFEMRLPAGGRTYLYVDGTLPFSVFQSNEGGGLM